MFEKKPTLNSYPRREGAFYLSTEAIDDRLDAVLEQDQVNAMSKTERKVVAVLCIVRGNSGGNYRLRAVPILF